MINPSIYNYVKEQETNYESDEIQVGENWSWNMSKHVQLLFHLKNAVFYTGSNDWTRAFKNIMQPILNLCYWTEDIELKDVTFFIEEKDGRALSFLVKKYHDEVYSREHDLDLLFDEITESDLDYGGVIVQKGKDMPEVIQLNSIGFCDQTDILGNPIGIKFNFSPEALRKMSKLGWGKEENGATISIDELIQIAYETKEASGTQSTATNKVPGKNIEVFIVRGTLPEQYLKHNDNMEDWYPQIQVIAFYQDGKSKNKEGVTLYANEDNDDGIKFHTTKKIHGRGLGQGVGETLLHDQIWTNFLTIHKMNMLEGAAKNIIATDDPTYTNKNKIQDMENNEITTKQANTTFERIPTSDPSSIQLYERCIDEWFSHAQFTGAAYDPILGKESPSGTTFRGQERSVSQGKGLHDRRRGQRAKFIEEIYRDWIIPDIRREILKGKKFLATLSTDELSWVSEQIATNETNKKIKEKLLAGEFVTKEEQDLLKQTYRQNFLKKGNKHLIEILKDEFADIELRMGINIAGKQKDLVQLSDKLLSIFQFIFANPAGFQQAMTIPALANSFESILEFGNINVSDFSSLLNQPVVPPQQAQDQAAPQPTAAPMQPSPQPQNG